MSYTHQTSEDEFLCGSVSAQDLGAQGAELRAGGGGRALRRRRGGAEALHLAEGEVETSAMAVRVHLAALSTANSSWESRSAPVRFHYAL